jgi:hypothetical protein
MSLVSSAVVGTAAVPFDGKVPCGFMRPTNHKCDDPSCPLDHGYVMAFDREPDRAIVAARALWNSPDTQILIRRFRVAARTYELGNATLEQGLLGGEGSAWSSFRALVKEHEKPVFLLTTISVLFSFGGSPGTMWVPQGASIIIPAHAEPGRPDFQHPSWLPGGLDNPDDLIPGLDEDDEEQLGL